jgi:hypothetical protein
VVGLLVATQAIGFPGFGLTAAEVAEVCATSAGMMNNPAMSKAVRLALNLEKERPPSLASRPTIGALTVLLDNGHDDSSADVTSIVISQSDAELSLCRKLGRKTWDALHERTRGDLVDAEQRLSRAYPELGGGRRDWGSFCFEYARAIEREVRLHVGPLIDRLKKAGAFPENTEPAQGSKKTRELGYYVMRIRDAKELIRKQIVSTSEIDAENIRRLYRLFDNNRYIVEIRNNAAHGNEQNPVHEKFYLRFREAILVDNILSTLISVN